MVYEEHIILEAIDQLRLRKARPDFQRISNFLVRNFSVSPSEVKSALEKCIEKQIVLKVEYKGNISYRNASRHKKLTHSIIPLNDIVTESGESSQTANSGRGRRSKKFNALLTNAFTELIVSDPDYLDDGVPGNELISKILSKDTVRSYTKKYLGILFEKLVVNGVLIKMESGNYLLGPNQNEEPGAGKIVENTKRVKINNNKGVNNLGNKRSKMEVAANSNSKNGNIRVGSRRKRAKKVFDPSDNYIPKKRGRPPALTKSTAEKFASISKYKDSSDNDTKSESSLSNPNREQSGGVCSVCHNNNKKSTNDCLVSCRECSNKAHLSCLNGDDLMLRLYPDSSWQCPHCKTCCICFETSDAGVLMVCSICADAYHAGCHEPHITDKLKNGTKWCCINCQMSEQLQVDEIHPNVQKHDIITPDEIAEELDECKQDVPHTMQSSSSDDDSNGSVPCSQTPPALSPQAAPSLAEIPEQKFNFSDYKNNGSMGSGTQDLIDPAIPDATHWTSQDVYNYFVNYFPKEAKVFIDQEIDGRSLLLMKRWDVLSSLNLKLGPALNIYRHVVKLQFRRDDPKLYWL